MAPFDPHLLDALEASEVEGVAGTVWRQILLPTSVTRPNQRGARWNTLGVETLYCSTDPDTAAGEMDHLVRMQPVPITRQRVTYPIAVVVSRVADLRPQPLGACFDYAYDPGDAEDCQLIGAAAAWLGLGGLIARSLRGSGHNLAIFVANLDADDRMEPGKQGFEFPPGPPSDQRWTSLERAP